MNMARQYSEDEDREGGDGSDEFVELDLDKTLTWTGNSVIVQRGAVFRMPLLVPHPSVLAIQFEIEGGYDIEFSLTFKEDHEEESVVMVRTCRKQPGQFGRTSDTRPVDACPATRDSLGSKTMAAGADPHVRLHQMGAHASSARRWRLIG